MPMPKAFRKPYFPDAVTITAPRCLILWVQPGSEWRFVSAAPAAPAMCGRRSVQSRQSPNAVRKRVPAGMISATSSLSTMCDLRRKREFAGGQGRAIEKRREHRSSRRLAERRRYLGNGRASNHVPLYSTRAGRTGRTTSSIVIEVSVPVAAASRPQRIVRDIGDLGYVVFRPPLAIRAPRRRMPAGLRSRSKANSTHAGRARDGGRAEAFSMVAHSARSPWSVITIARSSARTAGRSPPVARNGTRWLAVTLSEERPGGEVGPKAMAREPGPMGGARALLGHCSAVAEEGHDVVRTVARE